jgi:hypothetical protein
LHLGEGFKETRCRYFEIGLGRSATRSVFKAVKSLGIKAMHGTGGCYGCLDDAVEKMTHGRFDLDLYRQYEYVGHMASCHWRQLAEERPDAKFILPVRPLRLWLKSVKKKANSNKTRHDPRRVRLLQMMLYHCPPRRIGKEELVEGYHRHIDGVVEYFEGTDRLLVLNVWEMDDKELWNNLAAFVGREPPDRPFEEFNGSVAYIKPGNRPGYDKSRKVRYG